MEVNEQTKKRMEELGLCVVIDNTNLVPEQPFDHPIITTRDDMDKIRVNFDKWMENQGD